MFLDCTPIIYFSFSMFDISVVPAVLTESHALCSDREKEAVCEAAAVCFGLEHCCARLLQV